MMRFPFHVSIQFESARGAVHRSDASIKINKVFKMFSFALVLCASFGLSYSLNLRSVQEGSCRSIPERQSPNVDPNWVASLPYYPGGSKYHLYRYASSHPRFREMREIEFENEACLVRNTSFSEGEGTVFGFGGRILTSHQVRLARDDPGVIEAIGNDRIRQRVTLTDFRTFAVRVQCWTGADQKSWDVVALNPELDRRTQRLIEDHVEGLGFNREDFVFLNYENCDNLDGPLRETSRQTGSRGSQGRQNQRQAGGSRPRNTRLGAGLGWRGN